MIGDVIYSILSADSNITDVVSTRIYPVIAPEQAANPCIVYSLRTEPEDNKDGAGIYHYFLVLDLFGGYNELRTLANTVKTAIDRYSGTVNSVVVDKIILRSVVDNGYNESIETHHVAMIFRIRVNVQANTYLLLETGDFLLLETGDKLILQ